MFVQSLALSAHASVRPVRATPHRLARPRGSGPIGLAVNCALAIVLLLLVANCIAV